MSAISELSTIHRVKAKTPEEKRLAAKEAERYRLQQRPSRRRASYFAYLRRLASRNV
jgi:hypothetical protein